MTTAEARRCFGSYNRISLILGLNRSSVGRWGRMVPRKHRASLQAALIAQCKDRGVNTPLPDIKAAIAKELDK